MPTRPAPKPTPIPKPPTAPVKPVATRPAPAPVKPPAPPAPAPSRPAPAQRNAPSVNPAPVVKPPVVKQPTSKPTTTQPSTRSSQQPQKPKPTQPPGMNVDPAKLPVKPTAGQRVQGRGGVWWEYDAKKNSWGKAKVQAPSAGSAAPSAGVGQGQSGQTDQVDTQIVEDTQYDIPKTREEIAKEAESEVAITDPSRRAQFTDLMGSLGFGFGAQGGQGYATFEDVFKGANGDSSQFVLRDAMGRAITPENYQSLLGSDVYSEQGAKNIAGTALGNLITQARRSAAQQAETRSSSGVGSSGGVAAGREAIRASTGQEAFNELINKLRSGVTEIQSGRGQALLDAMKSIGANPSGVVQTVPSASGSAQTTSSASPNLPKLTPGAGGTFRTTTDRIIKGPGTKKSKADALKKLLSSHSLTPLQSSTINQMIKNLR